MARQVKPRKVSEFENKEELRQLIIASVEDILQERMGIVVDFDRDNYHPHSRFIRLRPGSLGGKGRGLAFLLFLLLIRSFIIPHIITNFPYFMGLSPIFAPQQELLQSSLCEASTVF